MAEYEINGKNNNINNICNTYLDLRNKLKSLYGENEISFIAEDEFYDKTDDEVRNRIFKNYTGKNNEDRKWYTFHKTDWYYKNTTIKMVLSYNKYLNEYSIKIEYVSRQHNINLNESIERREKLKKSSEGL